MLNILHCHILFFTVAPIIGRLSPLGDPIAVREGQAVTVELNVSANPQPNSYNWTHLRDDMIRVVTNENGITRRLDSVTFNPASRNHSGEYRLVINNSAGSSEYNFTLDVQCKNHVYCNLTLMYSVRVIVLFFQIHLHFQLNLFLLILSIVLVMVKCLSVLHILVSRQPSSVMLVVILCPL